ncbi:LOW QUALITY PROTEIN: Pentatricopeptide repeat [Dillenia turbinata]|uniref:Pentatricopeptide repeat n=1 Tax=Dillenia turbinata TaxID=194707 RepID=A0AAN8Z6S5_9MAGN
MKGLVNVRYAGGYTNNCTVETFVQFFHEMPERDMEYWNSLIWGFVHNRRINEAMTCFHRMQVVNVYANNVTLAMILSACAQAGALGTERWLHSLIDRSKLSLNVPRCRSLECHDRGIFYEWAKKKSLGPNDATILGVQCACTPAGLVDEGRKCFNGMEQKIRLTPKLEHHGCMVDLLGRARLLNEAYEPILNMPIEPHPGVCGALAIIHGNTELAERAINHILQLDLEHGGYLSIVSNIYANAGMWDDVAKVRELMGEKKIGKLRGCGSMEINGEVDEFGSSSSQNGEVHEFGVEEKVHPRAKEFCNMINKISKRLSMEGHVAFGLITTKLGTTTRILKNLQICADCHGAIRLISRIFKRESGKVRSRFQHFKEGSCSCGDYKLLSCAAVEANFDHAYSRLLRILPDVGPVTCKHTAAVSSKYAPAPSQPSPSTDFWTLQKMQALRKAKFKTLGRIAVLSPPSLTYSKPNPTLLS